jgi:hypothetical protein
VIDLEQRCLPGLNDNSRVLNFVGQSINIRNKQSIRLY